jgi:hypothetical protein
VLDIRQTVPGEPALRVRGGEHQIGIVDTANDEKTWTVSTNPVNQGMGVYENGTDNRFFIAAGGNVGLGTQVPQNRLTVRDNEHQIALIDADASSIMWTLSTVEFGRGGVGLYEDGQANRLFIANGGNVGIGTITPGNFRLAVNGPIRAKEITVETGWSDFVFEADYELMSLEEVEAYIEEHGHLPDMPSAGEVAEHGVRVGDMESRLLQKIEELTLHLIAMDKRLQELEQENVMLNEMLEMPGTMPRVTEGE